VQATKQLEIYKAPPIIVINLKRFKQSKQSNRYMGMFGGGGGQKLDQHVDFPLDGLDLSKYVLGSGTKSTEPVPMIYDCYAVSNHFGNMGFGHYTAFAKNPLTGKWYEFDDSRVSGIKDSNLKSTVVTSAAYNLFYRRRDWHEKNMAEGVNFDKLAIKPDMDLVNKK
jgi:ubiquitin C-terminal hydrolase